MKPVMGNFDLGIPGSRSEVCTYDDYCENPPSDRFGLDICDHHAQAVYDRVCMILAADELRHVNWERFQGLHHVRRARNRSDEQVRKRLSRLPGSDEPGYVYYIRFGGMVKIGFSKDPARRLKALPHEEVLDIRPGSRNDERLAHHLCGEWRVVGEWFEDCPEFRAAAELDTPTR